MYAGIACSSITAAPNRTCINSLDPSLKGGASAEGISLNGCETVEIESDSHWDHQEENKVVMAEITSNGIKTSIIRKGLIARIRRYANRGEALGVRRSVPQTMCGGVAKKICIVLGNGSSNCNV